MISIWSDLIEYASDFGAVFGYIAGVAWSPFVLRMVLRRKYVDFKLVLVPLALTDDYPKP